MTDRTIHRQMITPFRFTLKERAPTLHKFIATRPGLKLSLALAKLLFQNGVFCLKLFYLLFESLRLFSDKGEVLVHDGGAAPLLNVSVNEIKEAHSSPTEAINETLTADKPKGAGVQLHQVCTVAPTPRPAKVEGQP